MKNIQKWLLIFTFGTIIFSLSSFATSSSNDLVSGLSYEIVHELPIVKQRCQFESYGPKLAKKYYAPNNPDQFNIYCTIVFSPNGQQAAISLPDFAWKRVVEQNRDKMVNQETHKEDPGVTLHSILQIWDLKKQTFITLKEATVGYTSSDTISWSKDGKSIAIIGKDYQARVFDSQTGQLKAVTQIETKRAYIQFSPDGSTIVLTLPRGIRLWDLAKQKVTDIDLKRTVVVMDFSPDEKHLAVITINPKDLDGDVSLLSMISLDGTTIWEQDLIGLPRKVRFSPDGKHVIVVKTQSLGTLVFESKSGYLSWKTKDSMPAHWNPAHSLSFSQDGTYFLTAAHHDNRVLIYSQDQKRPLVILTFSKPLLSASFLPGDQIMIADNQGQIKAMTLKDALKK